MSSTQQRGKRCASMRKKPKRSRKRCFKRWRASRQVEFPKSRACSSDYFTITPMKLIFRRLSACLHLQFLLAAANWDQRISQVHPAVDILDPNVNHSILCSHLLRFLTSTWLVSQSQSMLNRTLNGINQPFSIITDLCHLKPCRIHDFPTPGLWCAF